MLILAMGTEKRTTSDGKYFHVQDAILAPKAVQKPHPPIMIAGGGEQLTLRLVVRLADSCNVFGNPAEVKFETLRRHCVTEPRPCDAIEKTSLTSLLLARDKTALTAKRRIMDAAQPFRGFAGTVSEVSDLIGQYRDAGVRLLQHLQE